MIDWKVLVISADDTHYELTRRLGSSCHVVRARTLEEAYHHIETSHGEFAACIIDTPSIGDDIKHIIAHIHHVKAAETLPVFIVVEDLDDEMVNKGFELGAIDVIMRPYTPYAHKRVMSVIQLYETRSELAAAFEELKEAKEETDHFLERMPGGLFRYIASRTPGEDVFDYVSDELIAMAGCRDEAHFREWTGNTFHGFVHPDDVEEVEREIFKQIDDEANNNFDNVTYRIIRPDGEVRWIEDCGHLVTDSKGVEWFYVVVLDITEKINFQEELKRTNDRLVILSEMNNDILFDVNYDMHIADVYGSFEDRFGRSFDSEDFAKLSIGGTAADREGLSFKVHEPTHPVGCSDDFDLAFPDREGEPTWARYQSVVLRDESNRPYRFIGRLLDTHEMMMEQLYYRMSAEHDGLTGLLNRKGIEAAVEDAKLRNTSPCSLMLIDADNFKGINDTYGHPVGDEVLIHLAQFLAGIGRGDEAVGRIGGDEFCVFFSGLGPGERLREIAREINKRSYADFHSEEADIPKDDLTVSIGVVSTDDPDMTLEHLYELADEALYEVKRQGRNGSCFIEA